MTGASRGIGRGIVDAFLEEGARVLATDVLADGLDPRSRTTHPHADRLATHVAELGRRRGPRRGPRRDEALGASTSS